MIVGETSIFANESQIDRAFERLSWRGLGSFVIHVFGRRYGIKSFGQTMLACSLDEVQRRISERGTQVVSSSGIVWAPDGDEAFDDGSYVLQFDVEDRVRLVAFNRPDWLVDPASVREVWLSACDFYSTLQRWRDAFLTEWESLPKT